MHEIGGYYYHAAHEQTRNGTMPASSSTAGMAEYPYPHRATPTPPPPPLRGRVARANSELRLSATVVAAGAVLVSLIFMLARAMTWLIGRTGLVAYLGAGAAVLAFSVAWRRWRG